MGFDKAFLRSADGQFLLAVLASELSSRFGQVVLASGQADKLKGIKGLEGYAIYGDDRPFSGPAGALGTVLAALGGKTAFVIAGDMPVVDWSVIKDLAATVKSGAEVAVPMINGRPEPLYAFYGPKAAPLLSQSQASGQGSLREIFPKLNTAFLELKQRQLAPGLFHNLNTPDEARAVGFYPSDAPQPEPPRGSEPSAPCGSQPEPPCGSEPSAPCVVEPELPSKHSVNELLRTIPKVDWLMGQAIGANPELAALPTELLLSSARAVVASRREKLLKSVSDSSGPKATEDLAWDPLAAVADEANRRNGPSLRPVINATGVVLHTNLGRAVLAPEVAENVVKIAKSYSTLEYDPQVGSRSDRQKHVEDLLVSHYGGEAALCVNNNAAALLIIASALASGRQIVISRGELAEIGASFRLGDILSAGGAVLKEIGATNRTTVQDYENALADSHPALIVHVHAGNYRIVGYSGSPTIPELVQTAKKYQVPLVCDLGSGSLLDLSAYLPEEPVVRDYLAKGVDLVTMSGDKLLGAGQAGLIIGRKKYIQAMKKHALARAIRIDKLNLAALESTLRLAWRPDEATNVIPTLGMLTASIEDLKIKAQKLLELIGPLPGIELSLSPIEGQAGGGSGPDLGLPSYGVGLSVVGGSLTRLEELLRHREVPVIARIHRERLWFDVRTIADGEMEQVAQAAKDASRLLADR
jgi:L-seryl-tRNA(Ser) seleniumtransferase